jgi:hypothetical protein
MQGTVSDLILLLKSPTNLFVVPAIDFLPSVITDDKFSKPLNSSTALLTAF